MVEYRSVCRCCSRTVGGNLYSFKIVWLGPCGSHPGNKQLDLTICQHAPGLLRKGGHVRSGTALRDHLPERLIRDERQVQRIVKRTSGAQLTATAMTSCAVCCVEFIEIGY